MKSTPPVYRCIIHVDLDAFFCAIEEQHDPSLRGQAFAVGGSSDRRGVVASCSYAARAQGVRSAMSMARALALCPQLIVRPTRHGEYRAASQQVMALLRSLTPLVEPVSIDEAFLDVSDLERPGRSGRAIARHLQKRIGDELNLSCSVGIATNKMVAKIATDYGKSTARRVDSPRAICAVYPATEAQFLAPLPANALWGVGPRMSAMLAELGIATIGDIALRSQTELVRRFGRHGYLLWQHSHGIDQRAIVTHREAKSISTETTFAQDSDDWEKLSATVTEQAAEVAVQLQREGLLCTTVKLKLRWSDFNTPTRQRTLARPTCEAGVIGLTALDLLGQLWSEGRAIRLVGVGVSGLAPRLQLGLWDEGQSSRA